jgi:beta-lactam-binding protein with PASTA domain
MQRDYGDGRSESRRADLTRRGQGRPLWRGRNLLVVAPAAALVGFLLGYLVTVIFIFPPQSTAGDLERVPDVVGLSADEAREELADAGLAYVEEPGLNHSTAVGTVVAQEPLAGQMARPGSAVGVTLSLGPLLAPVPDVVGLSHNQAEIALARAGYESELVWVDDEADVGQVVDTRPAPGTPLQLPGAVQLIVSAGPENVRVPDLATRSLAEARATLERLGLRLGDVRQDSASLAAPGTVLRQSPRAGAVVERATRVSVTVAVAPALEESGDTTRGGS